MHSIWSPKFVFRPRVYIILRGGLGNQLHQIAAGVKFAEIKGGLARIYPHIVDNANNEMRRGFFREFNLEKIFLGSNLKEVTKLESLILRILFRFGSEYCKKIEVNDNDFFENRRFSLLYLLRGWFQSLEYLPNCLNLRELAPAISPAPTSYTIHVRLTDYLLMDNNPLTTAYYINSYSLIKNSQKEVTINCFSDDIDSAKKILSEIPNLHFPEEEKQLSPKLLLQTLSNSSLLICSKSSLCWWASLVVSINGGRVISPWIGGAHNPEWLRAPQEELFD